MDEHVDILIEAGNPEQLDRDVQALPGCIAAVVGGPSGPFIQIDGAYVVRCFAGKEPLKFMVEHQGYGHVVRELEELV